MTCSQVTDINLLKLLLKEIKLEVFSKTCNDMSACGVINNGFRISNFLICLSYTLENNVNFVIMDNDDSRTTQKAPEQSQVTDNHISHLMQ